MRVIHAGIIYDIECEVVYPGILKVTSITSDDDLRYSLKKEIVDNLTELCKEITWEKQQEA